MEQYKSSDNRVLVLGGSIRAKSSRSESLLDLAYKSNDVQGYIRNVGRHMAQNDKFSNSEILAGAALLGARNWGSRIDYFPLVELFPPKDFGVFDLKTLSALHDMTRIDSLEIEPGAFDRLISKLEKCRGVVLSTPVYFGDRSSVANKFLQISAVQKLLLGKVFGMASVGAKRNGGQETANIFGLYEAISQGAVVVGNGPPTSQYGGTAIGGDLGHGLEDEWGLESAYGTGNRVGQVVDILNEGLAQKTGLRKIRITVLLTMDTRDKRLHRYLDGLIGKLTAEMPEAEFTLLDIIDHAIYRCLGCGTCPQNKKNPAVRSHCIIKDPTDYLETVRAALNGSDGAIIAGLNIRDAKKLIFRYQVLTERMRYIRRNDFELSNLPLAGLSYNEIGSVINPINSLKSMVSYMRHNTIFLRPIEVMEHRGKIIEDGKDALREFCLNVNRIKAGKMTAHLASPEYDPHGKRSGYVPKGSDRAGGQARRSHG